MVQDRMKVLSFTTKSPTGFRLVLKVVTLNGLEWCNSRYFALFCQIWQLWGPIMSKWFEFILILSRTEM